MSSRALEWLSFISDPAHRIDAREAAWIADSDVREISILLREIRGLSPFSEDQINVPLLYATLEHLPQWGALAASKSDSLPADLCDHIGELYISLQTTQSPRHSLLTLLTLLGGEKDLKKFCELILNDPPKGNANAAAPLLPLFRRQSTNASQLFPNLLDGLANPDLAPAILDLANFLTREKRIASHPAAARKAELVRLLEGLAMGLETLQESAEEQNTAEDAHQRYSDSIALAVSLCDTLALIGDPKASGALRGLLNLGHRRLRVEASAALARLGDAEGQTSLMALAAEPSARLRVLKYAKDLGIVDAIDERFREPAAVAEAELAAYLSEPTVMGVPPTQCELFDSCTQYWPGFEEPRMCFLFRFTYRAWDAEQRETCYTNIGIAGPVVHTFRSDLSDLSNADIYAAFAGWQAEHEDVFEMDVKRLPDSEQRFVDALNRRVALGGYQEVTALRLGSFFGEKILIASARKSDVLGVVVADAQHVYWYPRRNQNSIPAEIAYSIYKGRRLLKAFND